MSIENIERIALIIDTNTELHSLLSINLKTWVACDTIYQNSAQTALGALSKNPQIDLIITIARRGGERTAEIIHNYLNDHQRIIPMLIVGESTLENSNLISHIDNAIVIKPIIQACAKLIGVTARDMADMEIPKFYPIPIKFFSNLSYSTVELFEEDNEQYIPFANPNCEFDEGLIKNCFDKGVQSLFVKRDDRLSFVYNATQEFISKLDITKLNASEQISAQESTHELLRYKLSTMGISEDTIKLAQKHLADISAHVKKHPKMKNLLSKLMSNKASFMFKNVQILTFIGTHVLTHIDWGTPEQVEKFGFIAFFHDALLENDDQAKIRSVQDMKKVPLTAKQKELVKTHAQKAAELVHQFPKAPMGVDIIIRQHHGVTNGVGFSETFSTNISPMAIVLILAEELSHHIITSGENFELKEKIAELREKYTTQRFKKIIDLFESLAI